MVAPDKSFTLIPAADLDPDSPITTGLMNSIVGNTEHLEQWLGDSFVAAKDHRHDGIDSALITGGIALIEEKTITANTGLVTFSGLDGDTDDMYILTGFINHTDTAVTIKDFLLRPNGLTASQSTVGSNLPAGFSGSRIILGNIDNNGSGGLVFFWAAMNSTKSVNSVARERLVIIQTTNTGAGSTASEIELWRGRWADTTTNITSLEIQCIRDSDGAQVTGIGDGSSFALYKMRG